VFGGWDVSAWGLSFGEVCSRRSEGLGFHKSDLLLLYILVMQCVYMVFVHRPSSSCDDHHLLMIKSGRKGKKSLSPNLISHLFGIHEVDLCLLISS